MLWDKASNSVTKNLYNPIIEELSDPDSDPDEAYKVYLTLYFHTINYYVGDGDYPVDNYRYDDLYVHLVHDLGIEVDISHLKFPPVDAYKKRAVYRLDQKEAKLMGKATGFIDERFCDRKTLESLKIKPVGYIYGFKVTDMFYLFIADNSVLDISCNARISLLLCWIRVLTRLY